MTCSSCKNLDEKKKLDGKVSGRRYYCKKHKCYVGGDNDACDKYQGCYRSNDRCNEIYEEGRDFYNDTHSVLYYVVICIIAILLLIIARITHPELF